MSAVRLPVKITATREDGSTIEIGGTLIESYFYDGDKLLVLEMHPQWYGESTPFEPENWQKLVERLGDVSPGR